MPQASIMRNTAHLNGHNGHNGHQYHNGHNHFNNYNGHTNHVQMQPKSNGYASRNTFLSSITYTIFNFIIIKTFYNPRPIQHLVKYYIGNQK